MELARCSIVKYDVNVKEPPYTSIKVDEFECYRPDDDHLGENFADILRRNCAEHGHVMQFYTIPKDDPDYDYAITVSLTLEEWPHCTDGRFNCYCLNPMADPELDSSEIIKSIVSLKDEDDAWMTEEFDPCPLCDSTNLHPTNSMSRANTPNLTCLKCKLQLTLEDWKKLSKRVNRDIKIYQEIPDGYSN